MMTADRKRLRQIEQAFRKMPKEMKNTIKRYERQVVSPIWRDEIKNHLAGSSPLQQQIMKTGNTVRAGGVVNLRAGGSNRPLSGGQVVSIRAAEFGTERTEKYTRYSRTTRGKTHSVTRRTSRHLAHKRREGYVVMQAGNATYQRIKSLHVQTVIKTVYEAIDEALG